MVDDQLEAAVARGDRVQHFEAGADHLGPDAVGGDGGDAMLAHGGFSDLALEVPRGAAGCNLT